MKQYTDDQIQEMAFELGLCSPHGNPNPETYSFVKGFRAALSLIEKDEQHLSKSEIEQDFKELNVYLDDLCLQKEKDAGHLWISFTDKFNAFRKKILEQQSLGCGDAERYKQALIGCFGFILRLESGTKNSMDTGIIDDANGMLVAKALYYESKKESVPNSK